MKVTEDIDHDMDIEEIDDSDNNDVPTNTVKRYTCPIVPKLQTIASVHSSIIFII